ncbi:MAG: SusC/RagA family TonB-linked outer membrane protein [Gemmatimonadaceae bacterium]|nr:SusC/RagA family TonB-linked outer membrane protein [Gemmatimonadaceae bacterium]
MRSLVRSGVAALFALVAFSSSALAQRRITGTVTEAGAGTPIVGATIQVVGGTAGALTTAQGTYAITVPSTGAVSLRVRRIGYKAQTIALQAGQNTVDVALTKDVLQLDVVLTTAQQGTLEKKNAATATVQVTGDELAKVPAMTVDQALQGKVVGARINMNSGAPGGGGQIQIRGVTSVLGNGEPLFVIDGVIMSNASIAGGQNSISRAAGFAGNIASVQDNRTNRLADLNPNEVEDIQVLKGAAASALYGSRATNGVVIITTKRGRSGQARWNLTQRVGQWSLLRGVGQRRFLDTTSAIQAATLAANATIAREQLAAAMAANGGQIPFNDFTAQLYNQRALSWESSVQVAGGSEGTKYLASVGRKYDNGIAVNTNSTRDNARLNIDQTLGSRLTARLDFSYTRSVANRGISGNSNTPVTSPLYVFGATPSFFNLNARDAQGNFVVNRFGGNANPINTSNPFQTLAFVKNEEGNDRVVGAAELNYQAFETASHNLRFNYLLGVDRFTQDNQLYSPNFMQYEPSDGQLGTAVQALATSRQLNQLLKATYVFTPQNWRSTFTTTAGATQEEQGLNVARVRAIGLVPGIPNVNQGQQLTFQSRELQRDQAWFLRQEALTLSERLYLSAAVRGDRSSNNGDTERYFVFPSVQGSYRLLDLVPGVEEIKLRASWGQTGNRPLYGQRFLTLVGNGLIGGVNGLGTAATLGNPNIKPELKEEVEYGFDLQALDRRVSFEYTYFDARIRDALLLRNLPNSSGVTTQFDNVGRLRNNGHEAAINIVPVQRRNVTWVSRTAFQRIRNVVEVADNVNPFPPNVGFGAAYGRPRLATGVSTTAIWGNRPIFTRINGRDTAFVRDTIIGEGTPDFEMFFTNTVSVGNFTFGVQFDWRRGGDVSNVGQNVFDQYRNARDHDAPSPCRGATIAREDCVIIAGGQRTLIDTSATATLGAYRWAKWNGGQDARIITQDGSFVKLRELSVTYDVPQSITRHLYGSRSGTVRASLVGRNLAIWTKYWGMDPEVSNFGNNNVGRFVDLATYPPSRQVFLSIDFGF